MFASLLISLSVLISTQHGQPMVAARRVTEFNATSLAHWERCQQTCLTTDGLYGACEPKGRCSKKRLTSSSFEMRCERGLGRPTVCCPFGHQEVERNLPLMECGLLCQTKGADSVHGTCQYRSDCATHRHIDITKLTTCPKEAGSKICCPFPQPGTPATASKNPFTTIAKSPSTNTAKPPTTTTVKFPTITTARPSTTTTTEPPTTTTTEPPTTTTTEPPTTTTTEPPTTTTTESPTTTTTEPLTTTTTESPTTTTTEPPTTTTTEPPTTTTTEPPATNILKTPFTVTGKSQKITQCGKTQQELRPDAYRKWLNIQPLIIGGIKANPTAWPWMAMLECWNHKIGTWEFQCGGTLIDHWHVLTAAHCINKPKELVREAAVNGYNVRSERYLRVSLALYNRHTDKEELRGVLRIIEHPLFKVGELQDDIAILRLDRDVPYSALVQPICLPEGPTGELVGQIVTVAGWGDVSETTGERPEVLRSVKVRGLRVSECEQKYTQLLPRYFPGGFGDTKLCASWPKGGRDACSGDSGGPMVMKGPCGRRLLMGIVSGGQGCGQAEYPGIYTRVSAYMDWIRANTAWVVGPTRTPLAFARTDKTSGGAVLVPGSDGKKPFWLPPTVVGRRRRIIKFFLPPRV